MAQSNPPASPSPIDPVFQSEVFSLWNALATYPAAQTREALAHFFRESMRLLEADSVRWCLIVRLGTDALASGDLCHGWRIREMLPANPTPEVLARIRAYLDGMNKQDPECVGETTVGALRHAGRFRVVTVRDEIADFEQFRQTNQYRRYYQPYGTADRMTVNFPVNSDVESGFIFDRRERADGGCFSGGDKARAAFLLEGAGWFHRRLVLSRGILAGQSPCTPAQREILTLLLTGRSEKEIAGALGISPKTAHNQITSIHRNFGVRSRAELMALWM